MNMRLVAGILLPAFGLIGVTAPALAGTLGKFECNIVGAIGLEPIGDRDDGVFKGAVSTGVSVSEMDGPKVKFLLGTAVHRIAGGLAAGQMLEATGSAVMQEGKPARGTASGNAIIKFASGTLAALSGKTIKYTSKPTGFNQFELEYSD